MTNLDAMTTDELQELIAKIGNGVRPIAAARQLFADAPSATGIVHACIGYRNYAWNKLTATQLRLDGKVNSALSYEAICDRIYAELPAWAKW